MAGALSMVLLELLFFCIKASFVGYVVFLVLTSPKVQETFKR
jgi:hypothetical protein